MTTHSPEIPLGFAALGLADSLVKAVIGLGYEEPTPIQREAIPVLLSGSDVIGQAGTGTGKTAAFALPLLHRLSTSPRRGGEIGARALILVPTRELAMQVAEAIHKYARKTTLTVVPCYGGAPMDQQIRALRRGADIVVATPGRALDHLRRGSMNLEDLEVLVLDEADEMLDMGFAEDLETILEATPQSRQTALFAATMAPRIASIAERHLKKPARIHIKAEKRAPGKLPRIRQVAYIVSRAQKNLALGRILEFEDPGSAMVFCRTRVEVDELTDTLKSHGYGAQALHGGMEQKARDRVMSMFRSEKADVLVATDVAARGLDIDHVSHVINYDIPTSPEVYVHRIGRTGRIGREGVAITLVDPREQRSLRNIETLTKQKIEVATLPTIAALKAKRLDLTRVALQQRVVAGDLDDMRALVQSLGQDFDVIDIAAAAVALIHAESDAKAAAAPPIEITAPKPRSFDDRPDRSHADRPDRSHADRPFRAPADRSVRTSGARPATDRPAGGRDDRFARSPKPRDRDDRFARSPKPPDRAARPGGVPQTGPAGRRPRFVHEDDEDGTGGIVLLALNVGKKDGVRPADIVGAITGEAHITSRQLGAIRIGGVQSLVEVPESLAGKIIKSLRGKWICSQKVQIGIHEA